MLDLPASLVIQATTDNQDPLDLWVTQGLRVPQELVVAQAQLGMSE